MCGEYLFSSFSFILILLHMQGPPSYTPRTNRALQYNDNLIESPSDEPDTALCSSLGSLGKIVNYKKPLEISVTVYISKPQYYRAL